MMTWMPLAIAVVAFALKWIQRRRTGPLQSLSSSSLIEVHRTEPWKTYQRWSHKWGSIICFRQFGRDIVVVNGARAAANLLEKRSKIYADRPTWPMVDLIGRQDNVGFTYYGQNLKASRKLLHAALNPGARSRWGPLLEQETLAVVKHLLDCPNDWENLVKKHVASVAVRFTYGTDVTEDYVHLAEEINAHTGMALQPGWIVDSIPFLAILPAWLPGMGFKKWAHFARTKFYKCTQEPYFLTRAAVLSGSARSSFVADNLNSVLANSLSVDETILMRTAGSVYGAATDTTIALLRSFILLMTVFQDVQEKAYSEISSVVGHGRLTVLEDQSSLPYIEALIKELHRFNPVINLVPHSPTQDDEYEGCHIPRKAWVMCNVWSMTHDSNVYSDVDVFDPERHLYEHVKDPRDFTFGFGRRSCPGIHFANAETFLFVTRVLALFQILPDVDADGVESIPPLSYKTAFTSQPMPFICRFRIRDPELVVLL
ncbi:cytochrome P450 [Leucogyrophana mollusca]|uniref:Cytochrome P450 n=1 Tax=Leucogyrophana mollusca TaxID=85980 RepID=A0ACB8BAI0_9AGAM|nr:cytochrome P450 [Leucogyrophana mollusca]